MTELAPILMIHGVGCTGSAWSAMAADFRARGRRCETPTLAADKRVKRDPPPDLPQLSLKDYVDEAAGWAGRLFQETGRQPVLMGHSMGGLIVQKLAEQGLGSAAVLLTPASPADARGKPAPAQLFTFANIAFASKPETKAHKIWKPGFRWGVLNRVPAARHEALYAEAVYDSGRVYADLARPIDQDPHRTAEVDEQKVRVPVLTIGGAQDRTTPAEHVRLVAQKYARVGGDQREYAQHAHWIVDEPGTDRVTADIAAWLDARGA